MRDHADHADHAESTTAPAEPARAPAEARTSGVQALDTLLHQGGVQPPQVATIVEAHPGERDAMFARIHATLGSGFAQRVVAAMAPVKEAAAAKSTLVSAATSAVHRAIAEPVPQAAALAHPHLAKAGHALGVGLGVIVTEALAVVPGWNKPVLDDAGHPVESVPGAARVGNHDIRKRHEEVIGPKIAALVDKLEPGAIHDLVYGLGAGASEAPGDSYRLEAHLSDLIRQHLPTK